MKMRLPGLIAITVLVLAFESAPALAGLIQVGGNYQVGNTNFPNTFTSRELAIDFTVKDIGGTDSNGLTVTEKITSTGATSEWIEWIFNKPNAPIADNTTELWKAEVFNVPVTEAVLYDGLFVYWTINGVAATDIHSITDLGTPQSNPINPALGMGYGGFFSPAEGPSSGPLHFDLFLNNFGVSMAQGNMNTNAINGFVLAAHLRSANTTEELVPEPSTFALLAIGGVALVGYGWRRKRRAA